MIYPEIEREGFAMGVFYRSQDRQIVLLNQRIRDLENQVLQREQG